jgi:hypothetical protein
MNLCRKRVSLFGLLENDLKIIIPVVSDEVTLVAFHSLNDNAVVDMLSFTENVPKGSEQLSAAAKSYHDEGYSWLQRGYFVEHTAFPVL